MEHYNAKDLNGERKGGVALQHELAWSILIIAVEG